jgi:hypothetical protein
MLDIATVVWCPVVYDLPHKCTHVKMQSLSSSAGMQACQRIVFDDCNIKSVSLPCSEYAGDDRVVFRSFHPK